MALTKLPKSGIADDAIDASKIEDGTIQAVEISGTIPAEKLSSTQDYSSKTVTLPDTSVTSDQLAGSIANAKLSNSTITFRGTSRSLGDSFSLPPNVDWQSVITASGGSSTASAGLGYIIDTTSGTHTLNLPASASLGDTIAVKDYAGTFATNNLTIGRNGHNIQGIAVNSIISTNRASLVLVYVDSTKGWLYTEESNVADLQGPSFITATGGTITESGDFKIHTFTGDGCFVVSSLGNSPVVPTGGPSNVDYLVVAGGAGAGGSVGGGGGAGGQRTSFPSPGCNAGAFPISATTYPITVGAGGSGGVAGCNGTNGSNSIFSTITSAGGGGGAVGVPTCASNGVAGGSGGGGSGANNGSTFAPGGAGNTPPTSPSQGNPGGTGGSWSYGSGGGGGSGASGGNGGGGPGAPTFSGPGGNGVANSITGCSVTRGGGGGGGSNGTTAGTGGSGGGGAGANSGTGTAGTCNTGGGGGGSAFTQTGASGGKGIVIIRYKFQ